MAERNSMDLTAYWKELAQEQNVPSETVELVLKTLSNPKATERLTKLVNSEYVPRNVFQSSLDTQRNELNSAWEQNYKKYYSEQVQPEIAKRDKELTSAKARLAAFEQTYGPLEDFTPTADPTKVQAPSGHQFSIDDVRKLVNETEQKLAGRFAGVLKTVVKASGDHFKRFNEPLDVDAYEKFMVEKDLPPDIAYEKYIAPRLEELNKTQREKELQAARDEAVKEYATKHRLPVETKPKEMSPFFAQLKDEKPASEADKMALFREAYSEAETATP